MYRDEYHFVRGQKIKITITILLLFFAIGIDEWDIVFFFPLGCLLSLILGGIAFSIARHFCSKIQKVS